MHIHFLPRIRMRGKKNRKKICNTNPVPDNLQLGKGLIDGKKRRRQENHTLPEVEDGGYMGYFSAPFHYAASENNWELKSF